MMPAILRKTDSAEIHAFLEELHNQDWIRRTERSWWPQYVFHYTDVKNAIQILTDGKLFCRKALENAGCTFTDSASPDVMEAASSEVREYVRLYFRPRTPTQYRNEGIRPKDQIALNAHCPVPIFFLFDAHDILTRRECEFTNGNFSSSVATRGNTAEFLRNLPFEKIYHTGVLPSPPDKVQIIFHRNAEVLIPGHLDLRALKVLACRSTAEKDTLLALMSEEIKAQYLSRVRVAPVQLHEKKWTFVEQVVLSSESIVIHFSPDSETPGPFRAKFELYYLETGEQDIKEISEFNVNDVNPFSFDLTQKPTYYRFRITLDGNLAYENIYSEPSF